MRSSRSTSIPAVFAVTQDPFLIYTSNIFAMLGLRSLYILLGGAVSRLRYLRFGLAFILAFVGVKLLLGGVVEIPAWISLGHHPRRGRGLRGVFAADDPARRETGKGLDVAKQAIVTLAIGADYAERFERYCRANWTAYAKRHGFDLDRHHRTARYERTRAKPQSGVAEMPCPRRSAGRRLRSRRLGRFRHLHQSGRALDPRRRSAGAHRRHRRAQLSLARSAAGDPRCRSSRPRPRPGISTSASGSHGAVPARGMRICGLPSGQSHIVQTGVMVLSPKHHRELLEHVYHAYEDARPRPLIVHPMGRNAAALARDPGARS